MIQQIQIYKFYISWFNQQGCCPPPPLQPSAGHVKCVPVSWYLTAVMSWGDTGAQCSQSLQGETGRVQPSDGSYSDGPAKTIPSICVKQQIVIVTKLLQVWMNDFINIRQNMCLELKLYLYGTLLHSIWLSFTCSAGRFYVLISNVRDVWGSNTRTCEQKALVHLWISVKERKPRLSLGLLNKDILAHSFQNSLRLMNFL